MESEGYDPDHQFSKRMPPKLMQRKSDFYVNNKSPFVAQVNKCKSILNSEGVLLIHGLGASVNSAVNLALQLQSFYLNSVTLDATTSTVNLIDDNINRTDSGHVHSTSTRRNSAIHIKLTSILHAKKATPN